MNDFLTNKLIRDRIINSGTKLHYAKDDLILNSKEQEIILKLRELPAYSKMTIEKKNGEIYRYVIEESHLVVSKNEI